MEGVVQALQRVHEGTGAKEAGKPTSKNRTAGAAALPHEPEIGRNIAINPAQKLDRSALFDNKVFSFHSNSEQTRPYDVLRNLVLDDLAGVGSRIIAVTAPTPRCGTTVTASNLAFSISRLRTGKVVLLDCNEAAPGIANALGAPRLFTSAPDSEPAAGAFLRTVQADGVELYVASLTELKKYGNAADQSGASALSFLKKQLGPITIVLDLPPILVGDQTLPLMLGADAVILVLAVGRSAVADLEACKTYLSETSKVHVVLNKSRSHGL